MMSRIHWQNKRENALACEKRNVQKEKNGMIDHKRRPKLLRVSAVVAALLMTFLLTSCGVFWYSGSPLPSDMSEAEGVPSFESMKDASLDQADHTVDETNRNPGLNIEKNQGAATVDYRGSAGDRSYETLSEAYANVAQTVVEIATETVVNGGRLGNYVSSGAGSGVVISSDGYIVTNHHVIADADSITVRVKDGKSYEAILIGSDEASDIAVIWIDAQQTLQAARMGCSKDLIVGEKVFAIGNPLGSLGGTLTDGIISATARQIIIDGSNMTLLQTNAAINPGNSGGGLFNMAGELIGVVNAKCSQEDVEGLGFAIPVDTVYEVVSELIEYGYVRGVVDSGLTLYDVTSTMTAWRNFNSTRLGAYIISSEHCDGLKYGDFLLSIDGVTVTSGSNAEMLLSSYCVGDTVTIQVIRMVESTQNGKKGWVEQTISVELVLQEYVPTDIDVQLVR